MATDLFRDYFLQAPPGATGNQGFVDYVNDQAKARGYQMAGDAIIDNIVGVLGGVAKKPVFVYGVMALVVIYLFRR